MKQAIKTQEQPMLQLAHSALPERSFWDLIDLDSTYADSFRTFKTTFNEGLPSSKGRLREGETTLVKILIHLMCIELEELRLNNPTIYQIYASSQSNYFPVSTNRGQIRTMLDEEYSLGTISNMIGRLMEAQVILKKVNTSRIVERVKDEHGRVMKVITPAKNGRGDFILHVNKKILTYTYLLVEKSNGAQKEPINSNFETTENESIKQSQRQILEQPPHDLKDTFKNNNHNCGKSGVPLEPIKDWASAKADEIEKHRNEAGRVPKIGKRCAEKVGKSSSNVENAGDRALRYKTLINKDQKIKRYLPNKALDYYSTLLSHQIRRQLFPQYLPSYISQVEPHCKNILRLHISRLGEDYELGFQIVSRAVQMVVTHLNRKEGAFIYDLLNWLRLDNHYPTGTLKYVIDNWIPQEQKRLSTFQKKKSHMVRWQYMMYHSEKLYISFIRELKNGFSSAVTAYKQAFQSLEYYFDKYEISPKSRKQIRKDFADRTYSILIELNQIAQKESYDPTWSTFQLWQRQNQKK